VVAQELTLTRMAARPFQTVPPHQHAPEVWIESITRLVDIPTVLLQNPIARRGQAREIRHGRTSDHRAFYGSW
jgi:hypothetical protein